MTEPAGDLDERLARLRERRGQTVDATPTASGAPATEAVRGADADPPAPRRSGRRGAPAGSAKIITAGASATAMLGLIAVYGAVDRASASDDPAPAPVVDPAVVPAPAAPSVVVVLVDRSSGESIDLRSAGSDAPIDRTVSERVAAAIDDANLAAGTTTATAAPAPTYAPGSSPPSAAADPRPVPPAAIDLAVPVPPAPPPAAAPAAPVPLATSSGS